VLHACPISPYLIFSTTNITAECTNYEVCLVIFSTCYLRIEATNATLQN
jgi:hypothetical protein